MGKGSIKGRLGKDDQAAETKDPGDKSSLVHTFLFLFYFCKHTNIRAAAPHEWSNNPQRKTNAPKLPHDQISHQPTCVLRVVKVVVLKAKKNQKPQSGFFDTHGLEHGSSGCHQERCHYRIRRHPTPRFCIWLNFQSHVEMDLVGEEMTFRVQSGLNRNAN